MQTVKVVELINKATAQVTGETWDGPWNENRRAMVQAVVDGDGAVESTFNIEGSNDNVHWELIGTITLTDNNSDSDSLGIDYPWAYVRADLTAITGTDAVASALLSM
jgi:hypothetical protein